MLCHRCVSSDRYGIGLAHNRPTMNETDVVTYHYKDFNSNRRKVTIVTKSYLFMMFEVRLRGFVTAAAGFGSANDGFAVLWGATVLPDTDMTTVRRMDLKYDFRPNNQRLSHETKQDKISYLRVGIPVPGCSSVEFIPCMTFPVKDADWGNCIRTQSSWITYRASGWQVHGQRHENCLKIK